MCFQMLATNHRKYFSLKESHLRGSTHHLFIWSFTYFETGSLYVALALLYEKQAAFRLTKICLLCFSIAGIKGVCISIPGFHISYGRKSIKDMEII